MPTKYGRSPWVDQFPRSRTPSYPRHTGTGTIDAVVVGGGLTGCATAYAFAAAGVKVVLLEAGQIGRGNSVGSSGWLADTPSIGFADLEKIAGLRTAKRAFQSWRRAALDGAALLRRLQIQCALEAHPALAVAVTSEQAAQLKREHTARRNAGFDATLLNARVVRSDVGLDGPIALRTRDGATIDPYRACVGLAAAAASRGAQIFERSPVRKTTFDRKTATVATDGGSCQTRRVIVATGMPTRIFQSLVRHFWFDTRYFALTEPVPGRVRQQLGERDAIVRDLSAPAHVVRWVGERLLVSGADAERPAERQRDRTVVQRTGQLMYELSTLYPDISGIQPEYGWAADYTRRENGLPFIGPHRNFPHHLFAFGDAGHGVTGAFLASRVLLRHHFGEMDPADDVFGFHR